MGVHGLIVLSSLSRKGIEFKPFTLPMPRSTRTNLDFSPSSLSCYVQLNPNPHSSNWSAACVTQGHIQYEAWRNTHVANKQRRYDKNLRKLQSFQRYQPSHACFLSMFSMLLKARPLFLVVKDPQSAPTEDFFHKPSHAFIHNQPRSV
jgi:hypothetical protein